MISSSQLHIRLPIELHIEPIEHLDRCCPAVDQSACLDLPSGGREASQLGGGVDAMLVERLRLGYSVYFVTRVPLKSQGRLRDR